MLGQSASVEAVLAQNIEETEDATVWDETQFVPNIVDDEPEPGYPLADNISDDEPEPGYPLDDNIADEVKDSSTEAESYSDGIDVDLTQFSSTAVYGQVYDMVYFPENYVGKKIKMKGTFSDYYDEINDKHYLACFISDAAACCSQGIEFELTEDYKYPTDYPQEAADIVVEGTFDIYEEDGVKYCTLRTAILDDDIF